MYYVNYDNLTDLLRDLEIAGDVLDEADCQGTQI